MVEHRTLNPLVQGSNPWWPITETVPECQKLAFSVGLAEKVKNQRNMVLQYLLYQV